MTTTKPAFSAFLPEDHPAFSWTVEEIAGMVYQQLDHGFEPETTENQRVRNFMENASPLERYQLGQLIDRRTRDHSDHITEVAGDIAAEIHDRLVEIAGRAEQLPPLDGQANQDINRRRMERNLLEYRLEEEIRRQNPGLGERMQSGENQQHETMDRNIREVLEEHQTQIAALRESMTARFIEKLDRMPAN